MFGMLGKRHGFPCRHGTGVSDDRYAPRRLFENELEDQSPLVVAEGGEFPGRAARYESVRSSSERAVNERPKRPLIYGLPISRKGSDKRIEHSA